MATHGEPIGSMAVRGIFWSVTQSWGGRLLTFVLFIVLARFLSPAEFGIASAAAMVVLFITLVAEFGFGDAIVQRPDLHPEDVNLPFFVSLTGSMLLSIAAFLSSGPISRWLGVEGLEIVLQVVCFIAPITTISQFQEMNYRRNLAFRALALRVFIANGIAGMISILCASLGFGVWSIVVQSYLAALIGLIWLWHKPQWMPSFAIRPRSFWQLSRFGASVVSIRLVDFAVTRVLEIMIISRYGIAVFGLYSAGSRLYLTMMQLLQGALADVSLTILARISNDRERMAQIYLRAIVIAAYLAAPIFVVTAAVAPEICATLLGTKWQGVDLIARPLLLLGAVQSVQLLNSPYLAARGRPSLVLVVAIFKQAVILAGILLLPSQNVVEMVNIFVVVQLLATPLSFGMVMRELKVPVRTIANSLVPATVACAAGFWVVMLLRPHLAAYQLGDFLGGLVLGMAFVLFYGLVILAIARDQIRVISQFIANRIFARQE